MRLLREEGVRLLTFTGPPGVGKTRLAAQVAAAVRADYRDGAFLVRLAAVRNPARVPAAITRALGGTSLDHVDGWDGLAATLRERPTLLLLDNLEQVIAAAPALADLLAACPHLTLLATSRAPLRVRGETEFPVLPLPLSAAAQGLPLDELQQNPAVALFVARTGAVRPDFYLTPDNAEDVAAICRRLDGLPLAIEFAAARMRMWPPALLRTHLTDAALLDWLVDGRRDRPGRHRSMRRAIAWSYNLLTARSQHAFRALGAFPGGATPHALGATLAGASIMDAGARLEEVMIALDKLVDQGLVRAEATDGALRFTLPGIVRAYALDRLTASGEEGGVQARMAAFYAALVETSAQTADVREARLAPERENLEAAWEWAAGHDEARMGRRLASALPVRASGRDAAAPPECAHMHGSQPPHETALLSPREREVLALVAQGRSNKEIAQRLYIAEGTAKYHVRSLLDKLGADTRAEAVAHAGQRGLL